MQMPEYANPEDMHESKLSGGGVETVTIPKADLVAIQYQFAQTQWMLETIARSHSTCFADVHKQIIANRPALALFAKLEGYLNAKSV